MQHKEFCSSAKYSMYQEAVQTQSGGADIQNHHVLFRLFLCLIRGQSSLINHRAHSSLRVSSHPHMSSHSKLAVCFLSEQQYESRKISCLWGRKDGRSDGIMLQAEFNTPQAARVN